MKESFKAMIVKEVEANKFTREITKINIEDLPEGEVLIKVKYSSLNYKDALSASGNKGVTRKYPHTPGIDAAGIVVQSSSTLFKEGEEVLVTGYDLGMNTSGGFAEYVRVPAEWIVKLPERLNLMESMVYGTAGLTAAISVYKLISAGVRPETGDILVTGATGGVGSLAVGILHKLGYTVIAGTGKKEAREMLIKTGAKDIISREELQDRSGKPMLKERWAGVIDTVGGDILAAAIKAVKYGGSVTTCGNVASHDFKTSVYPFILRGVSLLGIDSVYCPMDLRLRLWELLSQEWKADGLGLNVVEVSLDGLEEQIDKILAGRMIGRVLVNIEL